MTQKTQSDIPPDLAGAKLAEICIAGTGSYAAEIAEYATAAGFRVTALVELINADRIGATIHGLPVIAPSNLPREGAEVAIAAGADRCGRWAELRKHGWTAATVIHPQSLISPSADIGEGGIVGPGVVIGAKTRLSSHVLIGRGVLIGHHVEIGLGAVVNPGANLAGNVNVDAGAQIGMGAIIVNGVSIGDHAVVAAGAVTVRDVASRTRVQGVPARGFSVVGA